MSASIRTYFSIQHIQSAAVFARKSAALEKSYDGRFSEALHTEHCAYVSATVFCAVAFLEATANELFSDAADPGNERLKPLGTKLTLVMGESWNQGVPRTARYSVARKYDVALELAGKKPFVRGGSPYQDVQLLTDLRNSLIHYEPEWVEIEASPRRPGTQEQKLESGLRGRFALNPMTGEGNPFYPSKVLGYGCAKWAVERSVEFADLFFSKLGITAPYNHVRSVISPLP